MRLPWSSEPVVGSAFVPTVRFGITSVRQEGWQKTAWKLWQDLGELHYPTSFVARQVSRVDWRVTGAGVEADDDEAAELLRMISMEQDTAETVRLLALNLQVAGQVWYVQADDMWRVLSTETARLRQQLADATVTVEGKNRSPVAGADSPLRAVLHDAEELATLKALARSQTRNRIAQRGVILAPKGDKPTATFEQDFEESATSPIRDEYAPSAVTPMIVWVDGDSITQWRHFTLDSPYDDELQDKIEAVTRRIARGLDIPPEVLLGIADVNHWNAWQISEDTYRAHVEPLATAVGEILKVAVQQITGLEDVQVEADPTALLAKRQSVEEAFQAWDRGIVDDDFVRAAIGASDDDAGDETQRTGQAPVAADAAGDRMSQQLVRVDGELRARVVGAMEMALEQARETGSVNGEVGQVMRVWQRDLAAARRTLLHLGVVQDASWDDQADSATAWLESQWEAWLQRNLDADTDPPVELVRAAIDIAGGDPPPADGDL